MAQQDWEDKHQTRLLYLLSGSNDKTPNQGRCVWRIRVIILS